MWGDRIPVGGGRSDLFSSENAKHAEKKKDADRGILVCLIFLESEIFKNWHNRQISISSRAVIEFFLTLNEIETWQVERFIVKPYNVFSQWKKCVPSLALVNGLPPVDSKCYNVVFSYVYMCFLVRCFFFGFQFH